MQFELNETKNINAELRNLKEIVKAKNTIPVLGCVKIEATPGTPGKVIITGTDLDTTFIATLGASVTRAGVAVVELKSLVDSIKSVKGTAEFSAGSVEYTEKVKTPEGLQDKVFTDYFLNISTGAGAKMKLPAVAPDQFPELPKIEGGTETFAYTAETIQDLINKTFYAVTREQSRFTLNAVSFEPNNTGLRLCATDGHRLSLAELKGYTRGAVQSQYLVGMDGVKLLNKVARGSIVSEFSELHTSFSTNYGTRKIVSRNCPGRFPNYEMVLPKDADYTIAINPGEVARELKDCLPFVNERTKGINFQPYYKNFVLKVFESHKDIACKEYTTAASCDFDGNGAPAVKCNANYLLDVMTATKDVDKIIFRYTNNNSQFEFTGENLQVRFKSVIMPLRFGDKDGVNSDGEKIDAANYYVLTDDEKQRFQAGNARPAYTAPAPKPAPAPETIDVCFPFPEGVLNAVLCELKQLSNYAPDAELDRKEFKDLLQGIYAKIENCQYE